MRGREKRRYALLGVLLAVGSSLPVAAEKSNEGSARWLPAISAFSGAIIQEVDAGVVPPVESPSDTFSRVVFGYVGISAELMTPELPLGKVAPRLFAHADASFSLDDKASLVNEGAPGVPVVPDLGERTTTNNFGFTTTIPIPVPVAAVTGRGSATRAQVEPLVVSAGLGVAIMLKAWDRDLRIKPSVEWMWHEVEVTNALGYAQAENPATPTLCPCALAHIEDSQVKGYHSLGPGLELELDAGRAGPLMLSVYTSGQAYHVLGDREFNVLGVGEFDVGGGSVEQLSTYELDPWQYRFAMGLRFRWMPE